MSQNDELDADFEEGATDEFAEEPVQGKAPKQAAAKKKSGGGLMAVLLLLVLGGGGIVAAPFLGIQLPFAIPGLPAPAPVAAPQEQAQVPAEQPQPAVAGLEAAPPAPEVAAAPAAPPEVPAVAAPSVNSVMPTSIDELSANSGPVIAAPGLLPEETAATDAPANDPLAATVADPLAVPAEDPLTAKVNDPATAPAADPLSATEAAPSSETAATPADATAAIPFPEADPLSAPNALDVAAEIKAQAPVQADPLAAVTGAAVAPVSDDAAKALEGRITALEKTLADLQDRVATKADLDDIKASLKTIEKSAAKSLETAAVKTARKEVENYKNGVMPDVVKVERPKSDRTVKAVAEKPATKQVNWILKSAKPGMAWVAEKGSNELKTVSVGDALAGIGKVTGIIKDSSGRWVVNGTKGYISQ